MALPALLDAAIWRVRSWDELKQMSYFTMANYTNFFLFILVVIISVVQARNKYNVIKNLPKYRFIEAPEFPPVEGLENFKWEETEPIKLRPFKPKYHLTMEDASALESLQPTELLLMDKNYKERIDYRRKILQEHHDIVVAVNDNRRIARSVSELYTFVMGTYLPKRFPEMFKMHQTEYETGKEFMLENMITGEILPTQPKLGNTKTTTLLETLGKQLDEDFLFLAPEADVEEDPKYLLEAYVTVCPSGFNPREKLGKILSNIHGPVPAYGQKLEGSMDRFFDKLEVGKYVKRHNWTITTNAELFAGLGGTHAHEGEEVKELDEIDVDKTYLRCERQTLFRLPKSQALVFAIKTYLYPIKQIKEEGSGEELAQAIDGLKEGSVPEMYFYKRGAVWGEAVKRYLRS